MKFLRPVFKTSSKIVSCTQLAIRLLGNTGQLNDDEVLALFDQHNIPPNIARDLLIFLPTAFVRSLLPGVNWRDTYIEMAGEKRMRKTYHKTPAYVAISKVVREYFSETPDEDTILKIAGRSAEFHVVNTLLSSNPQYRPEDVTLTEAVIIR